MEYYKIMWVPNSNVIWNMKSEEIDEKSEEYQDIINSYLDLKQWTLEYKNAYNDWLKNDDRTIYNMDSALIKKIRAVIDIINEKFKDDGLLFYWYDVDRDKNENHEWRLSPISGIKLYDLGEEYPNVNRLVSFEDSLCFPSTH
ncbi:MAG: hypothetical protein MI921_21835 [Cytophagales bacterium]|nr:hypothetical protein [Cytophagales bacterium]